MSDAESESEFLKCTCKECGNHIEFPATSARDTVPCPHCGEWTELVTPEDADQEEKTTSIKLTTLLLWVGLPLLVIIGVVVIGRHKTASSHTPTPPPVAVKPVAPPIIKAAPAPTNAEPAVEPVVTQAPGPPRPKSHADLKTSEITLEKSKEGNLSYAVGTVKNDSDHQRFGLRIEVDLISVKGSRIGVAKDYLAILEPHKVWHFHALIAEPKVVAARLASLKEDE
jgi:ribosomal protein S27E